MAKKNNNQVSAVRQAKHGWIWTLAFTVISILWIAPILVVLLNSFKRKAFIFRHPFTLGTEPLSAGWDKFIHGVERAFCGDRKSTRLNSSHQPQSRMPSSA